MKCSILGLMSGSSLDGLDCAFVQFDIAGGTLQRWQCAWTTTIPLPQPLASSFPTLATAPYLEQFAAHRQFGEWLGEQCASLIETYKTIPDYIASHGHTIEHYPDKGHTLQIGDPSEIARRTGCPVIYNFRNADVEAGGQGAPLAPVVEKYCFPGHHFYLNLGGIANLSVHGGAIRACDIAPCNQLLNFIAGEVNEPFDRDGQMAAAGRVQHDLLAALHRPITLPVAGAFSLDNNWIRKTYFPLLETNQSVEDRLRTTVEYISQAVARQVSAAQSTDPQTMLVTGGGAHNTFLVERIRANLPAHLQVVVPEPEIVDFKEAILIALCGALRINNLPNAFASVTGAEHDTVNGDIWDLLS
ncbi:MAG: anhydro-N-acetylmuramic acid kinase [Saprospiraceae bacterium]|nr:anhydro-N-acetylmuramic acid kinase [Saprospiraceae bacterium]